jgi:hypothetical protein
MTLEPSDDEWSSESSESSEVHDPMDPFAARASGSYAAAVDAATVSSAAAEAGAHPAPTPDGLTAPAGWALVALAEGETRVISDCNFVVQLNYFIPCFLSYSVALFLT